MPEKQGFSGVFRIGNGNWKWVKLVKNFRETAASYMFNTALNTPLLISNTTAQQHQRRLKPSSSISHISEEIMSREGSPEPILEIREKANV